MHIFFILFIGIFLFLAIVGSLIRWVFNFLLGRHTRRFYEKQQTYQQSEASNARSRSQESATFTATKKPHKKVFDDSEGEYVDFEEIE